MEHSEERIHQNKLQSNTIIHKYWNLHKANKCSSLTTNLRLTPPWYHRNLHSQYFCDYILLFSKNIWTIFRALNKNTSNTNQTQTIFIIPSLSAAMLIFSSIWLTRIFWELSLVKLQWMPWLMRPRRIEFCCSLEWLIPHQQNQNLLWAVFLQNLRQS